MRSKARGAGQPSLLTRLETSARTGRGALLMPRATVFVLAALIVPHVVSFYEGTYGNYVFQLSTAYAFAVLGGNIVTGFLGEASLAQGVFMAVGAYVSASAVSHGIPFLVGVVGALGISVVIAILLANAVVNLRGAYAALATFSLAFALPSLIPNLDTLTGGAFGITLNSSVSVAGFALVSDTQTLSYVIAASFVVVGLITMLVLHGRGGRIMLSVSENRVAATAFRVRRRRVVVIAWVFVAVLGTLGGAWLVPVVGTVSPGQFTIYTSLFIFVGTVVGGARSVLGAWIGGFAAAGVPVLLASLQAGFDVLIFGVMLLVVVILGPAGLVPTLEQAVLKGAARGRVLRLRRETGAARTVDVDKQSEQV
jgi:branched-chain amino acid transport system permease protein